MSKIEDAINQIGREQAIMATMNLAQQVAAYYAVLLRSEVPPDIALSLTLAYQTNQVALAAHMMRPSEDKPDDHNV